ncbi:MAG: energy transducer TonB [Pseudomonadales bacterium]
MFKKTTICFVLALLTNISVAMAAEFVHEVEVEATQAIPIVLEVKPRYPKALLKRGMGGKVTLDYIVDKRGKARNFRVVEAKPSRAFVRSAMVALKQSRFQVPVNDGKPALARQQQRSFIYKVSDQQAIVASN